MLERLTQRVHTVITLADDEARGRGAPEVGVDHLLLGLVREPRNLAHRILGRHGITEEAVEEAVSRRSPTAGTPTGTPTAGAHPYADAVPGALPLHPAAERVLGLALDEAASTGLSYAGCEHVLLGLARHDDTGPLLRDLGLEVGAARRTLEELVTGGPVR